MTRDTVQAASTVTEESRVQRGEVGSPVHGGRHGDAYDFERLEQAVEFLIDEHQRLTGEKEALLEELIERERRLTSLEAKLATERERREVAVEGVEKILGRLEQLRSSVGAAMEPV